MPRILGPHEYQAPAYNTMQPMRSRFRQLWVIAQVAFLAGFASALGLVLVLTVVL